MDGMWSINSTSNWHRGVRYIFLHPIQIEFFQTETIEWRWNTKNVCKIVLLSLRLESILRRQKKINQINYIIIVLQSYLGWLLYVFRAKKESQFLLTTSTKRKSDPNSGLMWLLQICFWGSLVSIFLLVEQWFIDFANECVHVTSMPYNISSRALLVYGTWYTNPPYLRQNRRKQGEKENKLQICFC